MGVRAVVCCIVLHVCSSFATLGATWTVFGPFVTGKTELDATPALQLFGRLTTAAALRELVRPRNGSDVSPLRACSELVKGCSITPQQLRSGSSGTIEYAPSVDWNKLIQGLSAMEVLEFQALAWTTLSVTSKARLRLHCGGVAGFYVLDTAGEARLHLGDIYRSSRIASYVTLAPGTYSIIVLLRGKMSAAFSCSVDAVPKRDAQLQLSAVHLVPDVWGGRVIGTAVAVAAVNPTTLTVQGVSCEVESIDGSQQLHAVAQPLVQVAPGLTLLLPCMLRDDVTVPSCSGGRLELRIRLRFGSDTPALTPWSRSSLECRSLDQSALFTFIDHDGSVQSAAVVAPLPASRGNASQVLSIAQATDAEYGMPCVVSLHGTGVAARAHADAYKFKPKGSDDYLFGVERMYVLAPTRHGAHNWQGVGMWTVRHSLAALKALIAHLNSGSSRAACASPRESVGCLPDVDDLRVLWTGHSMGGAGAWLAAATYADVAIAAAPLAGWTVKEAYGDSNTYMSMDAQEPGLDTRLKGVLLNTVQDQRADAALEGLSGVPLHVRVGADDMTTHPWYSRRMMRIADASGANVVEEVAGQAHWWWDTKTPNDGGVMNDAKMRAFYAASYSRLSSAALWRRLAAGGDAAGVAHSVKQHFEVVCVNPASCGRGRSGVSVLDLLTRAAAGRISVTACAVSGTRVWHARTYNVARLRLGLAGAAPRHQFSEGEMRALCAQQDSNASPCAYDGPALPHVVCVDGNPVSVVNAPAVEVCLNDAGAWAACLRS